MENKEKIDWDFMLEVVDGYQMINADVLESEQYDRLTKLKEQISNNLVVGNSRRSQLRKQIIEAFSNKLATVLDYIDESMENEDEGHETDFNVGEIIKELNEI